MITKKQWTKFCWQLIELKKELGYARVHIHGRAVSDVFMIYDPPFIKTTKTGTEPVFFKYGESFDNYTSLDRLYNAVTVTDVTMNQLKALGLFR